MFLFQLSLNTDKRLIDRFSPNKQILLDLHDADTPYFKSKMSVDELIALLLT